VKALKTDYRSNLKLKLQKRGKSLTWSWKAEARFHARAVENWEGRLGGNRWAKNLCMEAGRKEK